MAGRPGGSNAQRLSGAFPARRQQEESSVFRHQVLGHGSDPVRGILGDERPSRGLTDDSNCLAGGHHPHGGEPDSDGGP